MAFPRLHRTIALAALLLQAGCSDATGPESELSRAQQRWETQRPIAYDYTLRLSCFCVTDATRAVVVVVRGNVVESRTYADDGTNVPAQYNSTFPTIDGVFDIIEDAIDRDAEQADVNYHPALGYPTTIVLDYSRSIADEEKSYTITNFHVR